MKRTFAGLALAVALLATVAVRDTNAAGPPVPRDQVVAEAPAHIDITPITVAIDYAVADVIVATASVDVPDAPFARMTGSRATTFSSRLMRPNFNGSQGTGFRSSTKTSGDRKT